jgi:hypothetical protein
VTLSGWWRPSYRPPRRRAPGAAGAACPAFLLADWVLLIPTLAANVWPRAEVLRLYRARWPVELVFKRMKQLLRLNQIRSTHQTSVEATVRAW